MCDDGMIYESVSTLNAHSSLRLHRNGKNLKTIARKVELPPTQMKIFRDWSEFISDQI